MGKIFVESFDFYVMFTVRTGGTALNMAEQKKASKCIFDTMGPPMLS